MPHKNHNRSAPSEPTNAEKLLEALDGGEWHSTRELARRAGHTFAVTKFKLIARGYLIERERHPTLPNQHRYRLLGP